LLHDHSRKITESVISQDCDWGIVVNPVAHPDLVIKELARDEVTLWKGRGAVNEDVLIIDPEIKQTDEILKKLKKNPLQRRIFSSNLEVITALVAEGAGVGILPERVVGIGNRDFQRWSTSAPVYHDRICLIYRVEARPWPATKALQKQLEGLTI